MPYITQPEIAADLPPQHLIEALDDDGDGIADAGLFSQIEAAAAKEIDGLLGARYATPFAPPVPAVVASAARFFVLEKLYQRRGIASEQNPYTRQAAAMRSRLGRIGQGEEPLTPEFVRTRPPVSVVTEPAKTTSTAGHLPA